MMRFRILNSLRRSFSTTSVHRIEFSDEHRAVQATVAKIIEKDINPFVDQWEKDEQFDGRKVFKKLGENGLLGLTRSTDYNGQNLPYSFTVAMYEEFGRRVNCGGIATAVSVQTDMALPALSNFGSDELKRQFLAPSITGDFIACVGITESNGGSDVAAIKTTAQLKGDDLIINGSKCWITNGYQADWMCLLANTDQDSSKPHKNKSLICVPLNLKGITRSKLKKLGHHCSDTAIVNFDNVHVPAKNIIGEINMGFIYQMLIFQEERLVLGPLSYGCFQKILDSTIEYCKQRHAFGRPIIDNQVIHFKLAELQTEVEFFRALCHETAQRFSDGENVTYHASMIKLKSGRLGRILADTCLQYFGAMGYSSEMLISRAFRDLRLGSIAGGTDEIMLNIICKFMNTLPGKQL